MGVELVHLDKVAKFARLRAKGNRGKNLSKIEERIRPTAETALKHHPDPLAELPPEFRDAGLEIARIHTAITGKVNVRAARHEEGRSTKQRPNSEPIDRISKSKRDRYNAWAGGLVADFYPLGMILEVICDMIQPYMLDRQHQRNPGSVGAWVHEALRRAVKLGMGVRQA